MTRRARVFISALVLALMGVAVADGARAGVATPSFANSCDFCLRLFGRVTQESEKSNALISPVSVYLALCMTRDGADGKTREAMGKVLGVSALRDSQIDERNSSLLKMLNSSRQKVKMKIASALVGGRSLALDEVFRESMSRVYGARVQAVDFQSKEQVESVNAWISKETDGKVRDIVTRMPPRSLSLISTVYFKGAWSSSFDESSTRKADFWLLDGNTKPVMMMNKTESVPYLRGPNFQSVRLPYGDQRTEAIVIVPDIQTNIGTIEKQLTAPNWNTWMNSYKERKGHIGIPRFTLSRSTKLKEALIAMGMGIAFSGRADFSKVCKSGECYIAKVDHRAVLDVSEEGTEGSAATVAALSSKGLTFPPQEPPFKMIADRPFIFAVVDRQSSAIIFMARVVDPQS